jgi:hypothetical protein
MLLSKNREHTIKHVEDSLDMVAKNGSLFIICFLERVLALKQERLNIDEDELLEELTEAASDSLRLLSGINLRDGQMSRNYSSTIVVVRGAVVLFNFLEVTAGQSTSFISPPTFIVASFLKVLIEQLSSRIHRRSTKASPWRNSPRPCRTAFDSSLVGQTLAPTVQIINHVRKDACVLARRERRASANNALIPETDASVTRIAVLLSASPRETGGSSSRSSDLPCLSPTLLLNQL